MGTARTNHSARQKLRRKLEALGYTPAEVDQAIEAKRANQVTTPAQPPTPPRRRRSSTAAYGAYQLVFRPVPQRVPDRAEPWRPDDRGFAPRPADPLLNGQGRVTGIAAKVAKRKNTITRYQYDRLEAGERP